MDEFLDELLELDKKRVWIAGRYWFKDPPIPSPESTTCHSCQQPIQNESCFQQSDPLLQWHFGCFQCNTCAKPLTLQNAVLLSSTLYCTTCQNESTSKATITISNSYQQSLNHVRTYLAKVSQDLKDKKTTNDMLLPKTKRQRSILRMLSTKQQDVHVASSITLKTPSIHNKSPTLHHDYLPKSPINKISQNIKRTFSTAKHSPIPPLFEENDSKKRGEYMVLFTCSQDYILRHAAVIQLHTLLSDHFSLDELVSSMHSSKRHPPPSSALWSKLLIHLRPTQQHHNKTFGVPLAIVAERDRHQHAYPTATTNIPTFLNACFSDNAFIPIFIKSCIMKILRSGK